MLRVGQQCGFDGFERRYYHGMTESSQSGPYAMLRMIMRRDQWLLQSWRDALGPDKVVYLLANALIAATLNISVSVLELCTQVDQSTTTGSGPLGQ
jgi:hypothetical protein